MEVRLRVAAGARDAALRVHDNVLEQACAGQGRQGEDRGGGVAARRADDGARGAADGGELSAVQLGQPVDGAPEQVGTGMTEVVPRRVVRGVPEPEVRTQVDDRLVAIQELVDAGGDGAMREGQEHRLGVVRHVVVHVQVPGREMRVDAGDGVALALPTDETGDHRMGMQRQEPDQLGADVPGGADDRHADRVPRDGARTALSRCPGQGHGRRGGD